ncbi:MAG: hypothetical protein IJX02_06910 [Clostridia bacterium]|nr:hypothetical protein [Clostridia bacterium]
MKLKLEKTKAFWAYIVGGILSILVGVILMPVWKNVDVFFRTWGSHSVKIMISGLILGYVFLYLVKRIRRYSGTPAQVVAIVELVLMVVVATVCTVSEFFDSVTFGNPGQIFGLALWVRGASGVFTGYYCDSELVRETEERKKKEKAKKNTKESVEGAEADKEPKKEIDTSEKPKGRVDDFTVWRLALAIALITFGTYMFIEPLFESIHLQWTFSITIIAVGLFFFVVGFAVKPVGIKVDKDTPVGKKARKRDTGSEKDVKKLSSAKDGGNAKELDEGKVNIKLDNSATAMTKTSAYDAVKDGDIANPSEGSGSSQEK